MLRDITQCLQCLQCSFLRDVDVKYCLVPITSCARGWLVRSLRIVIYCDVTCSIYSVADVMRGRVYLAGVEYLACVEYGSTNNE